MKRRKAAEFEVDCHQERKKGRPPGRATSEPPIINVAQLPVCPRCGRRDVRVLNTVAKELNNEVVTWKRMMCVHCAPIWIERSSRPRDSREPESAQS